MKPNDHIRNLKKKRNKNELQKKLNKKPHASGTPAKLQIYQSKKAKIPPSIRQRGGVYFKHNKISYRLPMMLTFFSLLLLVLAVPSIIVISFGSEKDETRNAAEGSALQSEDAESISVAVMRTKADTIEDVPLENYIVGVVASEMPVDFEVEALKAQAVAARTYAVSHMLGSSTEDYFDLTDTIQHQVYKNEQELEQQWGSAYEENLQKIHNAVEATKGEIITYNNQPITPAYFSMSNGYTENSEDYWDHQVAYLRSVESPWDLEVPKLKGQETFSKEELETLLEIDGIGNASEMLISRKPSGRVEQISIGENTLTGREVREKLGLRSSDFTVKQNKEHYIFTTKGNGHGVGMSQYGADGMAKEGKSYQDILNHYYQDVEISKIDEAVPALVSK